MKSTIVVVREVNFSSGAIGVSYSISTCFSEFLDYLRDALNRQPEGVYPATPRDIYFGVCVDGLSFVLRCFYDESINRYIFETLNPGNINTSPVDDIAQLCRAELCALHIYSDVVSKKVSSSSFIRGINEVNRCFLNFDYSPLCYVNKSLSTTVSICGFVREAAGFTD